MAYPITVMIIEDDFRISAIHRQFVEEVDGFTVIKEARTAKETKAFLQECGQLPDLVLLDIYIPDVVGLDLFWYIRQQYHTISLIAVTAATEADTVQNAIFGGVFDYIIKPVDANRLKQSLLSFQEKRAFLAGRKTVHQKEIDYLIGTQFEDEQPAAAKKADLPKGIDPITLHEVMLLVRQTKLGITAMELSRQTGIGHTTARRYLEYLVSTKMLQPSLKYGTVGRPERQYMLRGTYE
ncbi:response regulator [Pueribacillus theae]|uniref:Response regulator n=1 Tax=Pueribacillus theae TaxID=2171751 RepID=A0A2U1JS39_9BACI|nr:response regulator [Pueribacillus theae]PWA08017.1 response regulator [Pueribacillus theae]